LTSLINKENQIKNSFIYMLPIVVSDLLPIITLPIFTRIFTQEDYGILALVTIYGLFASGLANFGMTAAFERNYFQYRDDKVKTSQLIYSTVLFTSSLFTVLALITFFFKSQIAVFITGEASHGMILFWAFCAYYFYNIAFQYFLIYYKNAGQAKHYSAFKILNRFSSFILSMLFVVVWEYGILGIIYSQLLSGFLVYSILIIIFLQKYKPTLCWEVFKESIKISYPLTPRIFIGVIGTQFDKYMINLLGSLGGTGIYALGKKLSDMLFTAMTALQNVFNPHVYQLMFDSEEQSGHEIGKYLTPFIYISVAAALLLVSFAEEVVFLLMAPGYEAAAPIAMVLTLYFAFLFFGKITSIQLIYSKKTHITSLLSFISIALNISLNIPFIYMWGAMGAAMATVISALTSGSISIWVAQKYYRIHWEKTKLVAIYGILFFTAIILLVLMNMELSYSLRLPAKVGLFSVYVIYGMSIKIVSKDNLRAVMGVISKKRQGTSE
jgi:O-antigen/teichoic acid export membrane protein